MTPNPVVPTPVHARAGQATRFNPPPRPAAPQATTCPATWHLGSRGVWKERRVKTRPA